MEEELVDVSERNKQTKGKATMKIVVTHSGGLDSTVLLAHLKSLGHQVWSLSVDYGQRHVRELGAAQATAALLGVPHEQVDLSSVRKLMAGSSQTDMDVPVPHGHYAEENMKKTVVPNRNMVLLALAGAWAVSLKADYIAYAAHAGDHAVYPDCREEFVAPLAKAMQNADWHKVDICRPFLDMTKAEIVELGNDIGAGPAMALSYSCYEGRAQHCGLCGTCQERRAAFRDTGVADPTQYEPAGLAELPTEALLS